MFGERWKHLLQERSALPALHAPDGTLTFQELDARARALKPSGDHFLAQGETPDILCAALAGLLSGVPVHLVEKDRQRRIPAIPVPAGTALIKQTVGGSGVRRCQFFTAEQIAADVDRIHNALDLSSRGVAVAAMSCAHSYGLTLTVLQTLFNGVPLCWAPQPFAQPLMDAMRHHPRAFLPGVPALWKAWLMGGVRFDNITLAISAGAPLTLPLERMAYEQHGLKLHNLYGTSECGAISWDATDELRTDGCDVGQLFPGVAAEIDLAGRLSVQSTSVGIGYDETLGGENFGKGLFTTCDAVSLENGHLHLKASLGRGINVAGRKLSPDEIAEKIRHATGLSHLNICGAPSRDPERCEDIVAEIPIPQSDINVSFKTKACASLAPWEVPRRWIGTET